MLARKLRLVFLATEEWLGGAELGPIDREELPAQLARLWGEILGVAPPDRQRSDTFTRST